MSESEIPGGGFSVVLTADRSLMADYPLLLDGMLSSSQTTAVPRPVWRRLVAPPVENVSLVRARLAPLGLRRIEAALLTGGFSPDDVAVVSPENLQHAIGPDTRIIGVSSSDPLGIAMNSTTMSALMGGLSICGSEFLRLMKRISGLRRSMNGNKSTIVLGGAGAWQVAGNDSVRRRLGIDLVVTGYPGAVIAKIFRELMDGVTAETTIAAPKSGSAEIPAIRGATTMGVVEVSRGCGLGCKFCSFGSLPMEHFRTDAVIGDIETNVASGVKNISLISEDLLRYGAGVGPDSVVPEKLKRLLREIRRSTSAGLLQVDHANISSVAGYDDPDLEEVHDLLAGNAGKGCTWINIGVETADGELLERSCGLAKIRPHRPEEWADVCREQVLRLARAGFMPMVSLIIGLPGEKSEHVRKTIKWVEAFRGEKVTVFPVLHAATERGGKGFGETEMTPLQWRLFEVSYNLNFKWIPRLFQVGQKAAGVSWGKRWLTQMLGKAHTIMLKRRLARRAVGWEK